jgi:multidrug efflux pump
MVISDTCIRRPVFASVLSLLIVLVGVVSFFNLSLREYPNIDEAVITVSTAYRGASASVIESRITQPLEDALAGIEGVDIIRSVSRAEQSQITVQFGLDRLAEHAASDVRDRVSRARRALPSDADEPVITKVEADANPIIWVAFASDRHSPLEVTEIANRLVKPRLQTLPGAADARVFGERIYAMRVWIDPERLAALGLTVGDVEQALQQQNVELPAGRIESRMREFPVQAKTGLHDRAAFEKIVVRAPLPGQDHPLFLSDVARVEEAALAERNTVRFRGEQAISIGLIKQATANPLTLAKALRERLPEIERELPEGMSVTISNDTTVFISRSIRAVFITIGEAIVLVAAVCFFFLRNGRAMLVPLVTIPVSIVGAFILMNVAGFSINTLTLLALVLAIGLVVDDAIVVLENIYRHIEEGMEPMAAAFRGIREIAFAVIAMTLTLVAVYAPIAFMTGRTGKLFGEFALTLAGAVLLSGFVALTLSPMMCARLLRHEKRHGFVYNRIETVLETLSRLYERSLAFSLKHRLWVMAVFIAVSGAGGWLLTQLKQELAPLEDRGTVIGLFNAPEGATLDYMAPYTAELEALYATIPEVERYFVISGSPTPNQGISFIGLTDWEDRDRRSMDIARELAPKMSAIPGITAFPVTPPSLGQSARQRPVGMVILSSDPYEVLAQEAETFLQRVREHPGFVGADIDLRMNRSELVVEVDRERASALGISVDTIGRTLETLLGGRSLTRYLREGEQYDVVIQLAGSDRARPQDIDRLFVRNQSGQMIPLSAVVLIRETVSPRELNHFGQRRAVTLSANLADDFSLGEALKVLDDLAKSHLPPGYATDYVGVSREFHQTSNALAFGFVLALLFIYLVLAAQFESWKDPFIILLTVPLSMTGALMALFLTGGTLNVYSQIGLITLVGLITKHGILIVEFAKRVEEEGKTRTQAALQASVLRLRPILMTTGAMVLGAIPLALATGAGAESRQQIGWVIVGGLSLGTFFTLFVVPCVYTLLAGDRGTALAGATKEPVSSKAT